MRCLAATLAMLSIVAPARADRLAEDWIGTWSGAATWTGCTVEGDADLALAITWRDGGIWLDGAALYDGLGELAPEGQGGALALELSDLQLSLRRVKTKAKLVLRTAAACTLTATLTRDGTGITACDDVVALAAVASSCGVTVDDDPADEIAAWRALTGKKPQKKAAKQCTARAAALRELLVAQDCLAPANDPSTIAECTETWVLAQQLARCQRVPAIHQQSTLEGVATFRKSIRALHHRDDAYEIAATKCAETSSILRDVAEAYGCL